MVTYRDLQLNCESSLSLEELERILESESDLNFSGVTFLKREAAGKYGFHSLQSKLIDRVVVIKGKTIDFANFKQGIKISKEKSIVVFEECCFDRLAIHENNLIGFCFFKCEIMELTFQFIETRLNVVMDSSNLNWSLNFSDCLNIESIKVIDTSLSLIAIHNCLESGFLNVSKQSDVGEIQILGESDFKSLSVIGKSLLHSLLIDSSKVKSIDFQDTKIGTIELSDSEMNLFKFSNNAVVQSLKSSNCKIDQINVLKNSALQVLTLERTSVLNSLGLLESFIGRFSSSQLSKIYKVTVEHHSFVENIIIGESESLRCIKIENSLAAIVQLSNCKNVDEMSIVKSVVFMLELKFISVNMIKIMEHVGSIFLNNLKVKTFLCSSGMIPIVDIQGSLFADARFVDCRVNQINLNNLTLESDSQLSLIGGEIFVLCFENIINLGIILISTVKSLKRPFTWEGEVETFMEKFIFRNEENANKNLIVLDEKGKGICEKPKTSFNDFFHLEKGSFLKKYSSSSVEFVSSLMGDFQILHCDLRKFEFRFFSTNLLSSSVISSNLPLTQNIEVHNGKIKISDKETLVAQKISYFNQLKAVLSRHGDTAQVLEMHASALQQRRLLLGLQKRSLNIAEISSFNELRDFGQIWFRIRAEEISLFMISISNGFGINWLQAFFFTILVSVFFFWTHYFALVSIDFNNRLSPCVFCFATHNPFPDVRFFWYYFEFINPVHSINFMKEVGKMNFYAALADFAGRVFVGFGIYQVIAAFRRHGKW